MNITRITSRSGPLPAKLALNSLILDTVSASPNISIEFYGDQALTQPNFSVLARDLFDFATAVYFADECTSRLAAPDHWSRTFNFDFAVQEPPVWKAASETLSHALEFLSGDTYNLDWRSAPTVPPVVRHRQQLAPSNLHEKPFDRVCLFSGGVDSLVGAASYLERKERVLLVGHYADTATSAAQRALAVDLRRRFPETAVFLQCRIQRHRGRDRGVPLPTKAEKTYRSRSFLFLSLATALAHSLHIDKLSMPENGLIALNSPLQRSRIGSLSTRTAHPVFLLRFLDAASKLGIFGGQFENPLLFQSKTDVVGTPTSWLRPLLKRSFSCAKPNRYQRLHVRHCGYCVPCLYRRVAFIRGGLDDPSDYAYDVLSTLNALPNKLQADFRALVAFAECVEAAAPATLDAMVLAHGYFPPEDAAKLGHRATSYKPWTDMLQRWANGFLTTVRNGSSSETARILGITKPRRASTS